MPNFYQAFDNRPIFFYGNVIENDFDNVYI